MDSPVMTEGESGEGIKGIRVRVRVEEGGEGGGVWTDGRTGYSPMPVASLNFSVL